MRAHRRLRRAASGAALGVALVLAIPVASSAADGVNIDYVETADDGTVSVLVAVDRLPGGTVPDLEDWAASIDGAAVEATAEIVAEGQIDRTTVLLLDASLSMKGAPIDDAKDAAKAFLASAPSDVKVGLVPFSGEVQQVIAPTTDRATLTTALDDISLTPGTRVYDAVVESVRLAGDEGARSVLLLTDGQDQGGGASLNEAVAAASDSGVILDVVALDQTAKSRGLLSQIADASGGNVIEAADAESLSSVFAAEADALSSQVLIRFPRPEDAAEDVNLEVSVVADGQTYSDSAFVPLAEVADTSPVAVDVDEPLVGKGVMMLGALALGTGLAATLGLVLVGSQGPSRSQVVSTYLGEQAPTRGKRVGEPAAAGLKDSAVALTSTFVKGDFESRLVKKLAGAGSTLTAAEWLLLHAGIAFGAGFFGFVFGGGLMMVVLLLVGAIFPWLYLKFKHSRRLKAFNSQLAETLTLMSGGLSAGLSLPQAIDTVVREGHEPMAGELRRTLIEARLGVEIEEGLDSIAERMQSKDFGWVVMAIRIQREVGGNLAELLNTVADTLREREYLRRQVKSLSAEGRLSGYILGAMPVAIFFYLMFSNPEYIRPLYTQPIGFVLLGVALMLLAVGGFFMSKLSKVEV